MEFYFTARGDKLRADEDYSFVEGNQHTYTAYFEVDEDWDEVTEIICMVCDNDKLIGAVPVENGKCLFPRLSKGSARIGLVGKIPEEDSLCPIISTNWVKVGVQGGANNEETEDSFNKTVEQIWNEHYLEMEKWRAEAEDAADKAETAKTAAETAKTAAENSAYSIKTLKVSAQYGIEATVEKTETEDGISLKFSLPKGDKGDKGDTGERGPQGEKGADGYTPVKGVDYFTSEEIANLNIPDKEFLESEISAARKEALSNTSFRVSAEPELEALRKEVDAHHRWLESNDIKYTGCEEELQEVKRQIGNIDTALEELEGDISQQVKAMQYYGDASIVPSDASLFEFDFYLGGRTDIKAADFYIEGEIIIPFCTSSAEVTRIADSGFRDCSEITSIIIPKSVTHIGMYAFMDCGNLESITIPDSVTSIGDYAFRGCTDLKDVYYKGTKKGWDSIEIGSGNKLTNATIHYGWSEPIIIDSELDLESENAVQNKVVTQWVRTLESDAAATSGIAMNNTQAINALQGQMGDIYTALESILALQSSYIGGDSV